MNNNKYYIPDLKDLYVGYQLEHLPKIRVKGKYWWNKDTYREGEWRKVVFLNGVEIGNSLVTSEDLKKIRTKYLDVEDIESLGFVNIGKTKNNVTIFTLYNKNLNLLLKENNRIEITKPNIELLQEETLFKGNCKSINELKLILKLIGYE